MCIVEHSVAHPTHILAPFAPDIAFLRPALVALVSATVASTPCESSDVTATAAATIAAPSHMECNSNEALPTKSRGAAQLPPLVEFARHGATTLQARLDALAVNVEAALAQLETNAALAAAVKSGALGGVYLAEVQAAYSTGVDTVHAAAAVKRAGLEAELVAADAALGEAIDATAALAEVRTAFLAKGLLQRRAARL